MKAGLTGLFLMLSLCCLQACAATETDKDKASATPVYYSDCSMVNLRATDASNMTQAERIAAEENALFDALDENRECNNNALNSSQQAVSAAASSGAQAGNGSESAAGQNGSADSTAQTQTTENQSNQQVISSNTGTGGAASGVNGAEITVCQISQENLAAATTPEDKSFWQNEVTKNCAGGQ